ncbi:MAG: hypothetical protein ACR2ID_11110 [Chthoniobacterales bacterium]
MIAQIKSATVTYSVFALARLFLDKPERYDVRLTATEGATLHQLGENGPVASDRRLLEGGAFAAMQEEFYAGEQTQSEPIKGNFSNVARDRVSGTLLGPTNHHSYQPQLRNLYEQRYSRRMSFQDFQRQIEIVSDPAVVEQWKEEARNVTTYSAKGAEPPETFASVAETERHFRQTHLPGLLREAPEVTVTGVASRRLPDRGLGRVIEDAWSAEIRSPSKMMQELSAGLRLAGLNIFRHKRGMLFVSPIRVRTFGHDRSSVSVTINGILEKLIETPGLNRKQLLEKTVAPEAETAAADRAKMTLGSDLRWLITEGYVIEFNDGTLDLPRPKAPPAASDPQPKKTKTAARETSPEPAETPAEAVPSEDPSPEATQDAGGMSVMQSVEPLPPHHEASAEESPATATPDEAPHEPVATAANPSEPAPEEPAAESPPIPPESVPSPS